MTRTKRTRNSLLASAGLAAAAAGAASVAIAGTGDSLAPTPRLPVVELGRRLFFDPSTSRSGRVACSDCHSPEHGFSDPRQRSEDETETSRRHSQGVADLGAFAKAPLHWDGEFPEVRDLLAARLGPPQDAFAAALVRRVSRRTEAARSGETVAPSPKGTRTSGGYGGGSFESRSFPAIEARVAQDGFYREAFLEAFGDEEATLPRVFDAMEAYLATVRTTRNAFDRHLAGEERALSEEAHRGYSLFEGKAGCSTCHVTNPRDGRAPLTDGSFHDTGVASRVPSSEARVPTRAVTGEVDGGLGEHTFRKDDRLRFKTPSLRDVGRSAPYMHDGSFETLADVVDYYSAGGTPHPGLSPHVKKLGLSPREKSDLVAFLQSLTGEERPGLTDPPAELGRETRVRIVDLAGNPVPDLAVTVAPAGETFRGVTAQGEPAETRTDGAGWATFRFPPTTHARFLAKGMTLGGSRPVPDTAELVTLMAVPEGKVALRAIVPEEGFPESLSARTFPSRGVNGGKFRMQGHLQWSLVRRLGTTEGLYVTEVSHQDASRVRAHVNPESSTHAVGGSLALLDLRPGAINFLDLRPGRSGIHEKLKNLEIPEGLDPEILTKLRDALRKGSFEDLPPEIRAAFEGELNSGR